MSTLMKSTQFFTALGLYFSKVAIGSVFVKSDVQRKRALIHRANRDARKLLNTLAFDLKIFGYDDEVHRDETFLIVSNHMSYLDPFLMASALPSLFITSVDMGEVPGLGHICRAAGCIFVERRNRTTIEKDLSQITKALETNLNVTIYPEGTSSNGQSVLPFKKSLLMAAVFARKRVLPVVLKYTEINGEPFCEDNADTICWYGDMTFLPHFSKLMSVRSLKAELHFLDPVSTSSETKREELSSTLHQCISRKYHALTRT